MAKDWARGAHLSGWPGGQVSSFHHLCALDTLSTASAGHVDKTVLGSAPTHGRPHLSLVELI
jgi:hypothetical protein